VALVPVDTAVLKGTGSKVGTPVILEGDYVLKDTVRTKAACHWAVYLDGFEDVALDEVTTDGPSQGSTTRR
jgi:hypothetical protein